MPATIPEQRVTSDEFRFAFRSHPAGVAVVTADVGDGPVAMTVSSVASISVDPPTLMFSASAISSSTPTICQAETIVVHLLASDQVALAKLGARKGADRFGDGVDWARLPTGEPYYPGATWLRGRVVQRVDVHGSTVIVVEAIQAGPLPEQTGAEPSPLVYHNRRWHVLNGKTALADSSSPFYVVYGRDD